MAASAGREGNGSVPSISRRRDISGALEREVTVHEAKTHLSRILKDVEAGETVAITRRGKIVAKLGPIRHRPRFGSMKGRVGFDESFFDQLPDEELRAWEGG